MLQDVGQEIDRERQIVGHDPGVVGGVLARGVGVEMAADVLDRLGDRPRRAPLGALERHVLEHVGDAVDLGRLVARADVDPDADARGLDARHGLGRDPQAVVQGRDPGGLAHAASRASCSMRRRTAASWLGRRSQRSGRWSRSARRARQRRRDPGRGADRIGELGRVRGREADQRDRRILPAAAPGGDPDRAVRVDQLAGAAQHVRHGRRDLGLLDPGGVEHFPRPAERVVRHGEPPVLLELGHQRARARRPSRPQRSNSRRSKLLATWMSMLGLVVGTTAPAW